MQSSKQHGLCRQGAQGFWRFDRNPQKGARRASRLAAALFPFLKAKWGQTPLPPMSRLGKVLFASHAVVVCLFILAMVVGPVIVGFEAFDAFVFGNALPIYFLLIAVALPFVLKYLK